VAAALDDRMRLTAGLYGFWEDICRGDVPSSSFFQQRLERVEIRTTATPRTPDERRAGSVLELTGGAAPEGKNAKRTILFNQLPGTEPPVERASKSFSQ
jgi:hypothetical protein